MSLFACPFHSFSVRIQAHVDGIHVQILKDESFAPKLVCLFTSFAIDAIVVVITVSGRSFRHVNGIDLFSSFILLDVNRMSDKILILTLSFSLLSVI